VHDAAALTELQLAVLDVVWERGEATTQDVWQHVSQTRPLALTTVSTILSRLVRRRVLEHRSEGRHYVYRAALTRHDVRRSKIRELTETLFDGDPAELLGHLVETNGIDERGARRLRALLDEVAR
jgi:predicted transcriptional regulator